MQQARTVTPVRQQIPPIGQSSIVHPQNYYRKVVSPHLSIAQNNQPLNISHNGQPLSVNHIQQIRLVQSPEKQTIFNHNSTQSRIVMSPNLNISNNQIIKQPGFTANVHYDVGSPHINNDQILQKENEKLRNVIASLQNEVSQSKRSSTIEPQENQALKDRISVLEQQLQKEKTSFEEFKNKIIMVIDENEKLQKIYEQLNQDYAKLDEQNQELNEIIKQKDKKMNDQHSDLETLIQENNRIGDIGFDQKIMDLEQENEQLRQQVTALKQNTIQVDDQTASYIQELENEINHQKDEIKIQQNLIIDYERKINVLIDENEKLSQIIQSQSYEDEDQNYRFRFHNLKEQLEKVLNNC